ncbi:hypothetical protein HPB48_006523 [Haemaphysalis longicornis]|uniref:Uncharacterized protein n=1 Tax=Haemaphysalis longicornis TaxID=44386 RepID=A0A9J6H1H9_HAELO|nr:hypothetical protein HPB48_006523 [Haemaphysalis longicornis]
MTIYVTQAFTKPCKVLKTLFVVLKYSVIMSRLGQIIIERIFKPLLQADLIFKVSPVGREYNKRLDSLHSFTRKV